MVAWEKGGKARALKHKAKCAEKAREERRRAVVAKKAKTERAQAAALSRMKAELAEHLTACQPGGAKEAYLKEQHSGHMVQAVATSYTSPFPTKTGASKTGVAVSVAHLTGLVGEGLSTTAPPSTPPST